MSNNISYASNVQIELDPGRFTALNLMRPANAVKNASDAEDKQASGAAGDRLYSAGAAAGFNSILMESLSERGGEGRSQRARDAAVDLKRYGGEQKPERGPSDVREQRLAPGDNAAANTWDKNKAAGGPGKSSNAGAKAAGRGKSARQPAADAAAGTQKAQYGAQNDTNAAAPNTQDALKPNAVTPGGNTAAQQGGNPAGGTAAGTNTVAPVAQGSFALHPEAAALKAVYDLNTAVVTDGGAFEEQAGETNGGGRTADQIAQLFNEAHAGGPAQAGSNNSNAGAGGAAANTAELQADGGAERPGGDDGGAAYKTTAEFSEMASAFTGGAFKMNVVNDASREQAPQAPVKTDEQEPKQTAVIIDAEQKPAAVSDGGPELAGAIEPKAETDETYTGVHAVWREDASNRDAVAREDIVPAAETAVTPVQETSGAGGASGFTTGSFAQGNGGQNGSSTGSAMQEARQGQVGAQSNAAVSQNEASPQADVFQHGAVAGGRGQAHSPQHVSKPLADLIPDFYETIKNEAALILNGSKHEFMMQLQPENLGKLIMKIVTEMGVVNARFIVDNEQARAGLESNVGLLKDALSEQGLQIEGFMVEVRHDNERSLEDSSFKGGGNAAAKAARNGGETGVSAVLDAGRRAFLRDRYFDQQSTIHFTA